jgi:hypothetical protein
MNPPNKTVEDRLGSPTQRHCLRAACFPRGWVASSHLAERMDSTGHFTQSWTVCCNIAESDGARWHQGHEGLLVPELMGPDLVVSADFQENVHAGAL